MATLIRILTPVLGEAFSAEVVRSRSDETDLPGIAQMLDVTRSQRARRPVSDGGGRRSTLAIVAACRDRQNAERYWRHTLHPGSPSGSSLNRAPASTMS